MGGAAREIAQKLSVAELARIEGVHPSTVRRRLRALDESTGGAVTMRRTPGNPRSKIFVTRSSLAAGDQRQLEDRKVTLDAVELLQKTNADLRREVNLVKNRLRETMRMLDEMLRLAQGRAN